MVKDTRCYTSDEYINILANKDGYCLNEFRLKDLEYWIAQVSMTNDVSISLWDYPLTEIDHILENDIDVVLVRFPALYGDYEYRWCEVPKEWWC